jgi:CheY-like chemotaxis protein
MTRAPRVRDSGIEVVGEIPFGSHFCQFYRTKQDLVDTLVPFFVAGLRNHEYCTWVASEPFGAEEAEAAMRAAMPDFQDRLARGQIEIWDYKDWYLASGGRLSQLIQACIDREKRALDEGYAGLRVTGNTFWLEPEAWDEFVAYEAEVNRTVSQYQIIGLCTYCLDRCRAGDVLDVCRNHQFALARRAGEWERIEGQPLSLPRPPLPQTASSASGRKVLVVDDNQNVANSIARLLRLSGYDVRVTYDAEAALALAAGFRPEVALLDIGLPGTDGYELARRLRADPSQAGVLLIAFTAHGRDEDRERGRLAGFDHYLVKPMDLDALRVLLASPLSRPSSESSF